MSCASTPYFTLIIYSMCSTNCLIIIYKGMIHFGKECQPNCNFTMSLSAKLHSQRLIRPFSCFWVVHNTISPSSAIPLNVFQLRASSFQHLIFQLSSYICGVYSVLGNPTITRKHKHQCRADSAGTGNRLCCCIVTRGSTYALEYG